MNARDALLVSFGLSLALVCGGDVKQAESELVVQLPAPVLEGELSLEEVLLERRSVRGFTPDPLTLEELAQLLWAAQGITDEGGLRTAPSAGALYPLELIVAAGNVEGLEAAVYRYRPEEHDLIELRAGDVRKELSRAALDQRWVADGAVVLVFAAVYERTTGKYGKRGERYAHIEVGHAAQNACLQAAALGLGAVMVGAFEDASVRKLLGLAGSERPLALLPVGHER